MRIIGEDGNNQENERKEDLQDRKAKKEQDGILNKAKKNAKSNFRMILIKALVASLPYLLPIIIVAVIVGCIIAAFSTDLESKAESSSEGNAGDVTIGESTSITLEGTDGDSDDIDLSDVSAIQASANGQYHITIDEEATDIYVERYVQSVKAGYYNFPDEMQDALASFSGDLTTYEVTDEELEEAKETIAGWFGLSGWEDVEPYLVRMLSAEIASSYPKIDDDSYYDSLEQDDIGNYINENGNYVVQGLVEIQRTVVKIDTDTGEVEEEEKPRTLTYVPLATLEAIIASAGASGLDPLNYFSFVINDDGTPILYYADLTITKTTNYKDDVLQSSGDTILSYELEYFDYSNVVEAFCMPYTFVFSLLQRTTLPEYVNAVIDLLIEDSEAVLMLQDNMVYVETESNNTFVQKTTTTVEVQSTLAEEGVSDALGEDKSKQDEYVAIMVEQDVSTYETYKTTRVTQQWEITDEVYISSADTWMVKITTSGRYEESDLDENIGEVQYNDNADSYDELSYDYIGVTPEGAVISYSSSALSSWTNTATYSYTFVLSDDKTEVVTSKFLGLWRNRTGYYTKVGAGADDEIPGFGGTTFREFYNEYQKKSDGGILVAYQIPDTESSDQMETAVDDVIDTAGNDIDYLLELLNLHDDTEHVTEFVKICFNEYYRDEHEDYTGDYYDVDVDSILDLYDSNNWTSGTGSSSDSNSKSGSDNGNYELIQKIIETATSGTVTANYGECLFWTQKVYWAAGAQALGGFGTAYNCRR